MELTERTHAKMTAFARVTPEKRKEFLDVMNSLQDQKLKGNGITKTKWQEDSGDSTCFLLTDEWASAEDLRRHCCTDNFKVFLGALKTLCVSAEVKYELPPGEAQGEMLPAFTWKDGRFQI